MNTWTEQLGLRAPVVCAPMGGVAGGRLAAAVSAAGALGFIGMGSAGSAGALRRELAAFRDARMRIAPWGIGMVDWGIARDPEMFEVALAAQPDIVSVSFGDWDTDPTPAWVDAVHRVGALSITQVGTVEDAQKAADAGVQAIVARGQEAGGHGVHAHPGGALLDAVLGAVTIPVLAAGAIHSARQVSELLDRGAAAVWVGTAFQACPESLISDAAREVLFAATGADTIVSRVMDVALERPWPEEIPERMIRTEFVTRWHGQEAALARDEDAKTVFRAAAKAQDYSVVPLDAGEGVTELREMRSAADVVAQLTSDVRGAMSTR